MEIKATDIRVSEQGLLTHQPIKICESGVLVKYQGAKPRDITLYVDDNMCIIKEDGVTTHIITAPFKIKIEKKKTLVVLYHNLNGRSRYRFNIIFYEQKRNNIKREYNIVLGIVTTYVWLKE